MGWTISLLYWDQVDLIEMHANGSVYIGIGEELFKQVILCGIGSICRPIRIEDIFLE